LDKIIAPANLPDKGRVRFEASKDMGGHLLNVIRALKPKADIELFDGTLMPDDLVVTTEPGSEIESAQVLPVPVGDDWGWWEWSKRALQTERGIAGCLGDGQPLPTNGTTADPFGPAGSFICYQFHKLQPVALRRIEKVLGGFAEDTDRHLFLLAMRGTPEALAEYYMQRLFSTVQYDEMIKLEPGAVVLNGGIHLGHELPLFLARMEGRGVLHNFDPLGYDYLSDYARRWLGAYPDANKEQRFAMEGETGSVRFMVGEGGQASGRDLDLIKKIEGSQRFPAIDPETFISSRNLNRLDFVKLDLEGAEYRVVPALVPVIRKFRPQLAISIYHDISHYWAIPELLMGILEGYRFRLGHYSSQAYELILYGTPEERL